MSPSSIYQSFSLLCLISLVLWWHTLLATFTLAFRNDEFTHILIVLPISIVLICAEWEPPRFEPNSPVGLVLLVTAALIGSIGGGLWGSASAGADVRLTLSMLAVVIWWIGSFIYCFGITISRMNIFALCFMLWLVPLPSFVINHIVAFLQQGSACSARLLFNLVHIPVTQNGLQLSVPGLTVEIAKECSGIRSSLMLVLTCTVVCHFLLRSAWSKVTIVLAAIVLSIAKNGLRIFVLSVLATYVDLGFLHGRLHHDGGIVFFLLASAILLLLLRLVWWAERRQDLQASVSPLVSSVGISKISASNVL